MDDAKNFYSKVNVDGTVNIPKELRTILGLAIGDTVELQVVKVYKKAPKVNERWRSLEF